MDYKKIIDRNIKEFEQWAIPAQRCIDLLPNDFCTICGAKPSHIKEWYKCSLISFLEEENKRLKKSKKEDFKTFIDKDTMSVVGNWANPIYNQALNDQIAHNIEIISYLKEM